MSKAERARLLADLQTYVEERRRNGQLKKSTGKSARRGKSRTGAQAGMNRVIVEAPPSHAVAGLKPSPTKNPLERAIVSLLDGHEMSPADIAAEVAKRNNLNVSQKRVGIVVHDLTERGVLELAGPARYRMAT